MIFSELRANSYEEYSWLSDTALSNWIVDHLRHYGGSICEVGAGDGNLLSALSRTFKTIHLTEPSLPMVRKLERRVAKIGCNAAIYKCGAEEIPLADKAVDITLSKSSFHHFADQARGCKEMVRISRHAIAVVEVVAPDDCCLDYLRELVLSKEPGRRPETIFTAQCIEKWIQPVCNNTYCLYFDQYVDLKTWLDGSELSGEQKDALFHLALHQSGAVQKKMQIHWRSDRLVQLRRMLLCIGFL